MMRARRSDGFVRPRGPVRLLAELSIRLAVPAALGLAILGLHVAAVATYLGGGVVFFVMDVATTETHGHPFLRLPLGLVTLAVWPLRLLSWISHRSARLAAPGRWVTYGATPGDLRECHECDSPEEAVEIARACARERGTSVAVFDMARYEPGPAGSVGPVIWDVSADGTLCEQEGSWRRFFQRLLLGELNPNFDDRYIDWGEDEEPTHGEG